MDSFGKRLEELRKKSGVSQEELAKKLEVTRQTISLWEMDLSIMKTDKLKMLCEFFNVKPDYFLFESVDREPLVREEIAAAEEEESAEIAEETTALPKPKKKSRKKTVFIVCSAVFLLFVSAILLFIAWLEKPSEGVANSVSSSSAHFDLVTFLQLIAGVLIFICLCIMAVLIVKYIIKRKK